MKLLSELSSLSYSDLVVTHVASYSKYYGVFSDGTLYNLL